MTNSPKTVIALAILGIIGAAIKILLQQRAARQMAEDNRLKEERLASLQRESSERTTRHAREAAEREAEREQKEKLIFELQAANKRTLDFLEAQVRSQQEAGSKRYDIIEKNSVATQELARAVSEQAREIRVLVDRIGRLEAGAGCRAGFTPPVPPLAASAAAPVRPG